MSSNCNGNCSSCSSTDCKDRKSFLSPLNKNSSCKKVIGVVSGKGGVGKSFVTASLASMINKKGYRTAIMDSDITGPSIPKMFGVNSKASANNLGLHPELSANGISIMSINLLLENPDDPVIWRGPVLANVVKQFWTDVVWGEVDFMFVDMPPGTGDVPLTVFQSLPVDGIVIVTSPQELVSMIVKKSYAMAQKMNIPILGVVENMSYVECPDCGKKIEIFGKSEIDKYAQELGVKVLGKLPINTKYTKLSDDGKFDEVDNPNLEDAVNEIAKMVK